jgi:hypothetical protein
MKSAISTTSKLFLLKYIRFNSVGLPVVNVNESQQFHEFFTEILAIYISISARNS